jgi:hypothetical protein
MTTELNLMAILDQFMEDLDEGVEPRIYELMASDPTKLTDLIPLLELITLVEASTTSMPDEEAEKVKARIFGKAADSHVSQSEWSMSRLVEESDPEVVAKGQAFGLDQAQMDVISSDTTPLDLDDLSGVVNELAKKHKLPFFDLLNWVNQLVSSVLSAQGNSSTFMVYARDGEREERVKPE